MGRKNISVYSVKLVKEKSGLYEIDNKAIKSPEDAYDVIEAVFKLSEACEERFGIIVLNTKNIIAGLHIVSIGSLNASIVHPREVFKHALVNNASGIILFHNHREKLMFTA